MSIFDVDDDHYDPIKEMNSLKYYPKEQNEMDTNNIISDSTPKQKEIVDRIHKTKKSNCE